MKKFRTRYGNTIQSFEIVKETEKQIVYLQENGRECREAKLSDWGAWHCTFEEAKQHLIDKCLAKIKSYEDMASYARNELEKINKIQP